MLISLIDQETTFFFSLRRARNFHRMLIIIHDLASSYILGTCILKEKSFSQKFVNNDKWHEFPKRPLHYEGYL